MADASGNSTPSNVTAPRKIQKRKRDTTSRHPSNKPARTSTPNAYARRTPPPEEPKAISDDDDGDQGRRSPPKQLKRPGAGARIAREQREAAEKARKQREEDDRNMMAEKTAAEQDRVRVAKHYNAVPERGREWRKTDSKIKGLRSLNNWVKSTLIQKFSRPDVVAPHGLLVLDMACGKGGDLGKWEKAPEVPALYVGCDIADVSIEQATSRYEETRRKHRRGPQMEAQFHVQDTFGRPLSNIPVVNQVGFNPNAGPGAGMAYGGFDVVSMMFALHYSFESEELARGMLKNVAGSLKKGGKFIGVMPNSDVISATVKKLLDIPQATADADDDEWDPEKPADDDWNPEEPSEIEVARVQPEQSQDEPLQWGNSLYTVSMPRPLPSDGVFRPPYGWKYHYKLEEAVNVPEYVVPWEGFRALAEDYGLELSYRKGFKEVYETERTGMLAELAERMGVRDVSDEEMEAASFYHAFCFHRV